MNLIFIFCLLFVSLPNDRPLEMEDFFAQLSLSEAVERSKLEQKPVLAVLWIPHVTSDLSLCYDVLGDSTINSILDEYYIVVSLAPVFDTIPFDNRFLKANPDDEYITMEDYYWALIEKYAQEKGGPWIYPTYCLFDQNFAYSKDCVRCVLISEPKKMEELRCFLEKHKINGSISVSFSRNLILIVCISVIVVTFLAMGVTRVMRQCRLSSKVSPP